MGVIGRVRSVCGVEPLVFIYALSVFTHILVQNQYMYVRISEDKGFPYWEMVSSDKGGCQMDNATKEDNSNSTSLQQLETEVQTEASSLYLYWIMSYSPMLLTLPFWGSYSDRVGRKVTLIVPMVSYMLEIANLMILMYFKLHIYVVLLGALLQGLSGNIGTVILTSNAYVADSVSANKLSLRYAAIQCAAFVAGTLGQLTSGLWISYLGFKAPLWFIQGCLGIALLYIIIFMEETRKSENPLKEPFFTLQGLKALLHLFTKPREDGGRKTFMFLLIFLGVNILSAVGTSSSNLLYILRTPLCFGPDLVGYFNAYKFCGYGVATVVSIPLLKKCMSELNIARIGYLSDIAGYLMFAFSTTVLMVFLSPAVGILRTVMGPVFLGAISRIVGPDEQGTLFAAISQLNTLGEFIGTSLFNNLYPLSLKFNFPGFVFVLAAGVSFIVLLFTSCLKMPPEFTKSGAKDKKEDVTFQDLEEGTDKTPKGDDIKKELDMDGETTAF